MNEKSNIEKIFKILFNEYGPQGWWPLIKISGENPTKSGSINGYHPNIYEHPKNNLEKFEISIGAILTQNTNWPNVEKALLSLNKIGAINPRIIDTINKEELKNAIRPAGYFNQKAKKLKLFTDFYLSLKNRTPTREELLSVWGIGKETADSILLYAYSIPTFVIDSYTKRIFERLGIINSKIEYDSIKEIFENELPEDFKTYQEYHALIVEHAKRFCNKKPLCKNCPLNKSCPFATHR